MDRIDKRILDLLQRDATLSIAEIGAAVNLSTTPCWRRIQNLEKCGVIQGRVALLDRDQLNLPVDVFVAIRTSRHDAEWLEQFADVVTAIPEIVEIHRMAGQVDYLLRVVVPDISAYDRVYRRIIDGIEIADVSSTFAMERIKSTTVLPLDYV